MFRAQRLTLFLCLILLSACAGVQQGESAFLGGDLGSGRAAGDGLLGSQPINSNLGDCELRDECPDDDVVTGAAEPPPEKRLNLLMEGFIPLECGPEVALQTWNVNEDDGILRGLILPYDETEPVAETSKVIVIDYGPEFRGASPCDFASFDREVPKNFERGLSYQVTTAFHGGFTLPLRAATDTLLGVLVLNLPHDDGSFAFTSEEEYLALLDGAEWVGAAKAQRVPAEE